MELKILQVHRLRTPGQVEDLDPHYLIRRVVVDDDPFPNATTRSIADPE